jgi:hypothetical protein
LANNTPLAQTTTTTATTNTEQIDTEHIYHEVSLGDDSPDATADNAN